MKETIPTSITATLTNNLVSIYKGDYNDSVEYTIQLDDANNTASVYKGGVSITVDSLLSDLGIKSSDKFISLMEEPYDCISINELWCEYSFIMKVEG